MAASNEVRLLRAILAEAKNLFVALGGEIDEGGDPVIPVVVTEPEEGDLLQYGEHDGMWHNRKREQVGQVGDDYVKTIWFTSQVIQELGKTFIRATFDYTMSDPSSMAIKSNLAGDYPYPFDFLTDPIEEDITVPSGKITTFLPYTTSTSNAKEEFIIEIYLANNDGTLKEGVDFGRPIGTLGEQTIAKFDSTTYSYDKDTKTVVAIDSNIGQNTFLAKGERLLIHFIGKIVEEPVKNKEIRIYYGGINNEMYMQTTHVVQMIEDITKLSGGKHTQDGDTLMFNAEKGEWIVASIQELKKKLNKKKR